jgi:hypothetical protein
MQQVIQNVDYAQSGLYNSISPDELDLFREAEIEYKKRIIVPCTGCRYCMPCPSNVSIPECFTSPLYVAEFNIKLRIRNNGCNDACRRNRHQIADQCMEEDQ